MIVLDTNVVSELVKPSPAEAVFDWFQRHAADDLFLTAITEAEIEFGLALLPEGRRRRTLEAALRPLFDIEFADRILPFDRAAAKVYAALQSDRRRRGRPMDQSDAQIAAITRSHGADIATRNAKDFVGCGIVVIDPWLA